MQNYLGLENRLIFFLLFHFEFSSGYYSCKPSQFLFVCFSCFLLLTAYVFSQRKFRIPEDQTIDF